MRVRAATTSDIPAISALAIQLGYPVVPEQASRLVTAVLQRPDHLLLVAEDESLRTIGWLHAFISIRCFVPAFAELGGMVVDLEHRRRGVGRALLGAAEEWASGAGCSLMRIRSNTRRVQAHRFYTGMEYEAAKTQRVFEKRLLGQGRR